MLTIVQSISLAARSKTTEVKVVYALKHFFQMLRRTRAFVSITLSFLNNDVLTPDKKLFLVWPPPPPDEHRICPLLILPCPKRSALKCLNKIHTARGGGWTKEMPSRLSRLPMTILNRGILSTFFSLEGREQCECTISRCGKMFSNNNGM